MIQDIVSRALINWKKYGWICFLVFYSFFWGCVIIHEAFYEKIYISPDACNYLLEAQNIKNGYGMNYLGLSGSYSWFSKWPAGYPFLIALCMFLLPGHSAYLASKVLTIIIIGLMLVVFGVRYKEYSWLIALTLLNPGLVKIFYFTWSEIPFLLFLILFVHGICYMIDKKEPKWFHYAILVIGSLGAFFMRYFGFFALLYEVAMFGILIISDVKNRRIKKKTVMVTAVCFASGLIEFGYLLMNRKMAGYATGLNRERFTDDLVGLTKNLLNALTIEVSDIILQPNSMLFSYLSGKSQLILIISCLGGLVVLLIRRHKLDETFVMITVGILYFALFIFIRYHSSMDPFGFRFFAPASTLIFIGLLLCFIEQLRNKEIAPIWIMSWIAVLLLLSGVSLYNYDKDREDNAYADLVAQISNEFNDIPARALVIDNKHSDLSYMVVRPDINITSYKAGESFAKLMNEAESYDYLCIDRELFDEHIAFDYFDADLVKIISEKVKPENQTNAEYYIIDMK